ncbi:hypothetical protein HHX48_14695 [Salinimonas sp. HHU 13199]|uniref:Uncharacterized protein n=1 Tax=Salinimonas profundi TaxID=2729140 RepID=A0ABR8LRD5_9ALTE|nr:hypothetical protein [Salinimonas profundi]MBD3586992.1 hypothetical protein [Salinimonas profundi]
MKRLETFTNNAQWLKVAGIAVALFIIFQVATGTGQAIGTYVSTHKAIDQIERRIGLDSAYLDVGNKMLGTPVDEVEVKGYISRINTTLEDAGTPVSVISLQNVMASAPFKQYGHITAINMDTAEQTLAVKLSVIPWWHAFSFTPLALLATVAVTPVIVRIRQNKKRLIASESAESVPEAIPHLVIDLKSKTIRNGVDDREATMQNKPFCFYVALVKYCVEHPDAQLVHHTDIPQELTLMANTVFARLIELGHTKRKRPDFNANLDKTLSEIRSALEDVFAPFAEAKDKFYPPRAQGEGSRSKQHSFALTNISTQDIEIIGN